jgi:hypothetical protein
MKCSKKIKQALAKGFETTIDRGLNSCIDPHKVCSVEPLNIEDVLSQYSKVAGSYILQQTKGGAKQPLIKRY